MQDKLQEMPYTQQFPFLIYAHFFVAKTIYALFCQKKNLCTLFLSRTRFTRFFAKTICASRPESFCALKVAIRKVQTFWASGPHLLQQVHNFAIVRNSTQLCAIVPTRHIVTDGPDCFMTAVTRSRSGNRCEAISLPTLLQPRHLAAHLQAMIKEVVPPSFYSDQDQTRLISRMRDMYAPLLYV